MTGFRLFRAACLCAFASIAARAAIPPTTFNAPLRDFDLPQSFSEVQSGDFNRDGATDLVTTTINPPAFFVFLSTGKGSFRPPVVTSLAFRPATFTTGDFDGDGLLDIAVVGPKETEISILLGQGDGTFQTPKIITVGVPCSGLSTADFNGDSRPDLLTTTGQAVAVLLGNGDASFSSPISSSTTYAAGKAVVADFNQDGIADVVTIGVNQTPFLGVASVLIGNGDGTFRVTDLLTGAGAYAAAADLDGDGYPTSPSRMVSPRMLVS